MPQASPRSRIYLPIAAFVILIMIGAALIYRSSYKSAHTLTPEEQMIKNLTATGNGLPLDPTILQSLTAPKGNPAPPDPKIIESLTAPSK